MSERNKSYFYNMRNFHNFIKIDLYNQYTKNIENLLELCVGKCGDLLKWHQNDIKNVIGYDINTVSINNGKQRYKKLRRNESSTPHIQLYVEDLSEKIIDTNINFDVVSSQFAFHYFFRNQETFNIIMKTIKKNLKIGGFFIGTIFDGKSLLNLQKDGNIIELNDTDTKFRLRFHNLQNSLFGNKINVYINGTVLDIPMDEYIVDFDEFVKLMKINGFELVETKMFETYFSKFTMPLKIIEKKVSFLNRTFVFQKLM